MPRKGIAPWADGAGEIGYDGMAWGGVNTKELKADKVIADSISTKKITGDVAASVVAEVSRADDAIVVTKADGTSITLPLMGETALGWCRKRRIEKSGDMVSLYWEDPADGYAQWSKTIIVKKEGSYPETPTDGTLVTVNAIRDQYKKTPYVDEQADNEKWYYRAFPVSAGGNTSYNQLNKFGFWHYAIWIDREDAIEATCVHNMEGYDNQDYRPIKMIFAADVADNVLDWGDWGDAQFMPRPCMLKSDGTVDYYLNPDNYNQKADGTATKDISDPNYDGNAMVEWGQIYTKVETTPTRHYIYFCSDKLDDSYECYSAKKNDGTYGEHWYMPIYEGRVVNNVMRSLSTGTNGASTGAAKPTASTSMEQEMTYAKANGTGWNITCWADENLVAMLGIIVMGRLNSAIAIGKLAREIFDNYNERGQAQKDAAAMNKLNNSNAYPANSTATNEAITSAMLASATPYAVRDYSINPQTAYANSIYKNALGSITNNELAAGLNNASQNGTVDTAKTSGAGAAYTKSALDRAMEQFNNNGIPEGTISQTTYSYTAPTRQDYKANALANLFGLNGNGNYF